MRAVGITFLNESTGEISRLSFLLPIRERDILLGTHTPSSSIETIIIVNKGNDSKDNDSNANNDNNDNSNDNNDNNYDNDNNDMNDYDYNDNNDNCT